MPANPPVAAAVPLSGRRPASRGVFGHTAVLAVVATCLFAAAAVAQTYDVLKAFTFTGLRPYAGLIQGTDGNLYGTTYQGGTNGYGTIFRIDTNGKTLTTLHSFAGSDGANPYAGLIQATDGNLYGATLEGGQSGYGTIFKIDTNGTTLTTLHSFAYSDGAYPAGCLIQGTDGNLYGATLEGGASGYGTVFKIDTNGTTFTTLHSFAGSDGATPYAGLIQGTDGNLYGTTYRGGANNDGTIFKIHTDGTSFTTLHSFVGSDGVNLYAGLIQGTDGNLYGTTAFGGANNYGTIFKIDTNGSTLTTLHSFAGSDGANPEPGLVQGTDGNLYGTTLSGGATVYYGTIFKIDTSGSTLTTLHSFGSIDAVPYAGLV
ncbi:MAG: choice-of-anchor tandem repeat GloVer-containing protein, partial [Thermoanaerobaculia bacterium]